MSLGIGVHPLTPCDWAAISKVVYSLWVSPFPLGNVASEVFFAQGWGHLSARESPPRTRLLLCPHLGLLCNEIFPIAQVETPVGESWETSAASSSRATFVKQAEHSEAVTSPKPCVPLSLQHTEPGNGSNPVNPAAPGSTPTLAQAGRAEVLHIPNLVLLRAGRCPNISVSSVSTLCFLGRKAQVFS